MAFFKKNSANPDQVLESALNDKEESEQPLLEKKQEEQTRLQTRLVLPEGNGKLPDELRYVMQFMHSELPLLEEGVISIDGYKREQETPGFALTVFLRNNTEEAIDFTSVPIAVFDTNNNLVARRVFSLSGLTMQPKTSVPYRFEFYPEHFMIPSFDLTSWYVAFHMENDEFHSATPFLRFNIDKNFSIHDKIEESYLQARAHVLRALEETQGQINFIRGGTSFTEEGNLLAEIYIRNGREEEISLPDELTCTIFDAQQEEVASASFNLSEMALPPSSITAYTLEYNKSELKKQNPDLSDWSIQVEE